MYSNKFHFQERDFIVYFPATGNEGRNILQYGVAFRDRVNSRTQQGPRIYLRDVLAFPEIREGYPHTVGFYQESTGKGNNWNPNYIEIRVIHNEEQLREWFLQIEGI